MSFLNREQSKLMQLNGITDESLGTELPVTGNHRGLGSQTPTAGRFLHFFQKNC